MPIGLHVRLLRRHAVTPVETDVSPSPERVVRVLCRARVAVGVAAMTAAVVLAGAATGVGGASRAVAATSLPRPAHVVLVVLENHGYSEIIGNRSAPWLNSLAGHGALLTQSYAVRHPSEPNYLALFSGSTQGLTNDSCPHRYTTSNLASVLAMRRLSFRGYSESLPRAGWTGCYAYPYGRKHSPWVDFANVPATANQPFTAFPTTATGYARLPSVSFVVPNLLHDMHDGTISAGDAWVRQHLAGYLTWARTHNSVLIVTFDEDDTSGTNRVATILAGAHVRSGVRYAATVNHYRLLATVEGLFGTTRAGLSARYSPITGIWN